MAGITAKFIITASLATNFSVMPMRPFTNTLVIRINDGDTLRNLFKNLNNNLHPEHTINCIKISECEFSEQAKQILGVSLIRLLKVNLQLTKINIEEDIISPKHQAKIDKLLMRNCSLQTKYYMGSMLGTLSLGVGLKFSAYLGIFASAGTFVVSALNGIRERYIQKAIKEYKSQEGKVMAPDEIANCDKGQLESIKAGLEAKSWSSWAKGIVNLDTWRNPVPYYRSRFFLSTRDDVNEIKREIAKKLRATV